jgi:hypothetical protein
MPVSDPGRANRLPVDQPVPGAGPHRAHAREPDTGARGIDYSLSSSVSSFVMELFQPLL